MLISITNCLNFFFTPGYPLMCLFPVKSIQVTMNHSKKLQLIIGRRRKGNKRKPQSRRWISLRIIHKEQMIWTGNNILLQCRILETFMFDWYLVENQICVNEMFSRLLFCIKIESTVIALFEGNGKFFRKCSKISYSPRRNTYYGRELAQLL